MHLSMSPALSSLPRQAVRFGIIDSLPDPIVPFAEKEHICDPKSLVLLHGWLDDLERALKNGTVNWQHLPQGLLFSLNGSSFLFYRIPDPNAGRFQLMGRQEKLGLLQILSSSKSPDVETLLEYQKLYAHPRFEVMINEENGQLHYTVQQITPGLYVHSTDPQLGAKADRLLCHLLDRVPAAIHPF